MKKWMYILMMAVLVVPLIVAACAPTEEVPTAEPTTVTPVEETAVVPPAGEFEGVDPSGAQVLWWHQHTGDRKDGLDQMVAEFNQTNEWGIQVTAEYAGSYADIYDKMIAAIAGDDPSLLPNLVSAYPNSLAKFQLSDTLVDMDALIDSSKWGLSAEDKADYFPGVMEADVSPQFGDGHFQLAFPPQNSMEVLYYNADWLKTLGYDGPPKTWAEFEEMTCKATDAAAGTIGYEIDTDASRFASMVFSRHASYFLADGSAFDFENDTVKQTMTFMKQLYDKGCIQLIAEAYGDQTDFGNYKTLFTIGSSSGLPYYATAVASGEKGEFQWSVAPLPYMDGGTDPVQNIYGAPIAVPKTTPEQELAGWLFLKWFTSSENNARWAKISGYFPVRASAADSLADYFTENPAFKTAFDLLKYGTFEAQWCACYEDVRRKMATAYSSILDGADIDTTLAQLQTDANTSLAENAPGTAAPVADLYGEIKLAKKLVVSTDPNYKPQSFLNDKGELDGFDIDVAKEVAKQLGVDVEFVTPDWDMITGGNWGGRWDLSIGSMTPTEERAQVLWFTDPYYYTPASFAVHKDNTTINSVADLTGKKVGLGTATTYESYLNGTLSIMGGQIMYDPPAGVTVVPYSTDSEAIQDLALGDGVRLDAVMSAQPTIQTAIDEGQPLKYVGTPAFYEPLAFALDKSRGTSDKMISTLNSILKKLHTPKKDTGISPLGELSIKWYGIDLTTVVTPEEVAPTPSELVIGTTDKATVLDPADAYDFHTWEIFHNTMDTLLHYIPGTTDLEPGLAVDFPEVSPDGLQYTFKLKQGLTFADGTPFNAEAYKWAIDRVARLQGDPNWLVTAFVQSVEAVDEYTIKFTLTAPSSLFPLLAATPPYSAISPKCYSADAIDADSTCGGIGPYTISKWERDVELVLEANPVYPVQPKTAKIIVKYYADATTLRLAVESGEIDIATKTLNPTDYADLQAAGKLQVITGPGAQIRYLCFNVTTPPFDNKVIRQAISYAVDRDQLVSVAFQGTHMPLYTMVPIGMWSHLDSFPKRDVAKAVDLLTQAGFSATNKMKIDLWWTPSHYGPTEADVATILKDNLEETGLVEVNLQNTEWATYKQYMSAGSMPFFLLGWYPDYLDPDNYTWNFAQTDASDDTGIFYSNPDMDALLLAGQTSLDLRGADRLKIYEDIQKLWVTEAPTIPLTQGSLLVVAQPNVKGVVMDPNMMYHYFLMYKE